MIFNAVDNITDRTIALQVHKNHANLLTSRLPLSIKFRFVIHKSYALLLFIRLRFDIKIDIQFLKGDNCVDILLTSTAQNNGIIKLCKT